MAVIVVFDEQLDYGVLLKRLLERSGHTVVTFSDRSRTREWVSSNRPDLVIVNSNCRLDTPEVLAQCLPPENMDSVILVVSCNGVQGTDNNPQEDILWHPLELETVEKRVERLLTVRQALKYTRCEVKR